MPTILEAVPHPELVFGLACPIGVDVDQLTDVLSSELKAVGYSSKTIKLTKEMLSFPVELQGPYLDGFYGEVTRKMDYATHLCQNWADPAALSAIAVRAIRKSRKNPDIAEKKTAYIVRQLKRPEEVDALRKIYGRQFILISAYGNVESRKKQLINKLKKSLPASTSDTEIVCKAEDLVARDASEAGEKYGQQLRETFHLADVFVDGVKRQELGAKVNRFIQALFGRTDIAPSKDEYGMYAAKSASLRSTDLSRQVGAALFTADGELLTQGCNEAPKAFGGTYWDLEEPDYRDVRLGYDPNEEIKREILRDLFERLSNGGMLSDLAQSIGSPDAIIQALTSKKYANVIGSGLLSGSLVLDLTEYGRIVHAEMCAICDAARNGRSVKGATLYCTTFPCHNCTKHILAAGIYKVIYIEPYPKSRAKDLHENEIEIESEAGGRVSFMPFLGISPYRYRDIFQKGRRKGSDGQAKKWLHGDPRPLVEAVAPSYLDIELLSLSNFVGDVSDVSVGAVSQ